MKRYATIFILLLVTEVAIAIFHFHKFVRGFIGDLLVIPLLYTFVRLVWNRSPKRTLGWVLMIAFAVEILQLVSVTELVQIENKLVLLMLGQTFDGWDLVAYWFGILPVLLIEKFRNYEAT
jgi:hypothetical protein